MGRDRKCVPVSVIRIAGLLLLSLPAILAVATKAGDTFAAVEAAPYQVSISHVERGHLCSGAIIGTFWILTSAQCTHNIDEKRIQILAGIHDLINVKFARIYLIDYVITHAKFDTANHLNDISLIRTMKIIKYSARIRAIQLYWRALPPGAQVTLSGWTWRKTKVKYQHKLRSIRLKLLSLRNCTMLYKKHENISIDVGHICMIVPKDAEYCNRESGSPMVYNQQLLGISSFGPKCANGDPYVASRIPFFYDFIRSKVQGCARCHEIEGFHVKFFPSSL